MTQRLFLAVLLGLAVALAIRVSEDHDWRELAQDAGRQINLSGGVESRHAVGCHFQPEPAAADLVPKHNGSSRRSDRPAQTLTSDRRTHADGAAGRERRRNVKL